MCHLLGQYENALSYHNQALEIFSKSLPLGHIDIASTHYDLGTAYKSLFQYEDALLHYKVVLDFTLSNYPDGNILIAVNHSDIGTIYKFIGKYEDALNHYHSALEIRLKLLASTHIDIAISYSEIGSVYACMGQHEDAFIYYGYALKTIEKEYLSEDFNIENFDGSIYNSAKFFCSLYSMMGVAQNSVDKHEEALELHKLALQIGEQILVPNHPEFISLYSNIGYTFNVLRNGDDALYHHLRALEIGEQSLAQWHHTQAILLMNLAETYYDQGKHEKAFEFIEMLIERLPDIYQNIMSIYNNNVRINRLRSLTPVLACLNTIVYAITEKASPSKLYNILLISKDISTEAELVVRRTTIFLDNFPDEADTHMTLIEKQQYLDRLLQYEPENKNKIEDLNKEIRDIEAILSDFVQGINFKRYMDYMTTHSIMSSLPRNSALLEYGWFKHRQSILESEGRYYAFLVRNDNIYLGYIDSEKNIHSKLSDLLKKMENIEQEFPVRTDISTELSSLYKSLVAPFAKELGGVKHLYIAPDNELYKLPFELLLNEDKTLTDITVSYLSTGRDLIWFDKVGTSVPVYSDVAALADPLFSLPADKKREKTNNADVLRQSRDLHSELHYDRLPFSKVEVNALERVIGKVDTRYELNAKKSTLAEIGAQAIIHISTHGFSLQTCETQNSRLFMPFDSHFAHHERVEDPLIRSGLVFSGANDWIESDKKKPLQEYDDGFLNAKEILAHDLFGTDLLVLSACQTGLGETKNGEGIQGLRRAFELVGVRSLICTLWNINDLASAILMERFYIGIIKEGRSKLQALNNAKCFVATIRCKDIIEYVKKLSSDVSDQYISGLIDELEKLMSEGHISPDEKLYSHPYYWAGYILQGESHLSFRVSLFIRFRCIIVQIITFFKRLLRK